MKKYLMILAAALFAAAACTDDPVDDGGKDQPTPSGKTPTVTISSDSNFDDAHKATITLTLSDAADADVTVKLANADVQSGKTKIPADYKKNVTIKAGEKTAAVEVEADVTGLSAGDFQAAIKIDSAEGAEVAANSVVYINISFVFKPDVNIYADGLFASDATARITLKLSKATTDDVTVTLDTDAASTAEVSYDKTVVIPAGQSEVDVPVTVAIPEDLAPGIYPAIIKIANVDNGLVGTASSVTINLSYPFATDIIVDGVFNDWEDAPYQECALVDGALFTDLLSMKFCANSKYVYVYLQYVNPGFEYGRPFNFYIDTDGDPATGAYVPSLNNAGDYANIPPVATDKAGIRWYIELALHDGDHYNDWYTWGGRYGYTGADGDSVWSGLGAIAGPYDPTEVYAAGVIEDGIGHLEIQLNRKVYELTGNKARFFGKLMNGADDWNALGTLPQEPCTDGHTYTPADMFTVYLPDFVE